VSIGIDRLGMSGPDEDADRALFQLEARNAAAERIIATFCAKHAVVDGLTGFVAGVVPVPFANWGVFGGQLAYQFKKTYPVMLQELADVYQAEPDAAARKIFTRSLVKQGLLEGLAQEVIGEILGEGTVGLAASGVPWVGAPIGAAVDVFLAVKMTWRVGVLISAYFQNGGYVGGDRKATLKALRPVTPPQKFRVAESKPLGKQLVKIARLPRAQWAESLEEVRPEIDRMAGLSRPGILDVVRAEVAPVNEHLVVQTLVVINSLKELSPSRAKLFEVLTRTTGPGALAIPRDVVAAALDRATGLV
jgi:hypothetical protein